MSPRPDLNESRLHRFPLDRRITVLVLFVAALVVGAVATFGIPIELMPAGFTPPFLSLHVPWTDAPSQEVMDKLILPLEEELSTVRGVASLTTIAYTGRARVFILFKQSTDLDLAYREVQDRIERARRRFPDDADRVYIHKEDSAGLPVAVFGIATDRQLADTWDLIQKGIVRPLERVPGVASVDVQGLEEKEILIELDRQLTESAGLNVYELSQFLADDNFTLPSGRVYDGSRKLLLRSVASFRDIDELRDLPITPDLKLGEIARITYDEPEKRYRLRANGEPAVAAVIFKEGEANAREVSRGLLEVVDRLNADPRLENAQIIVLFDQGRAINESLETLVNSGMIGGVIAAVVLLFFLRRFRLTMIIALSIPFSMVLALTVMFFADESLNIITLLGLMICIGLLVDNSVVVAENIHRLHQKGLSRRDASIRGAAEIALAVTMSTLTTVIVFLPASLVEGPGRFFLVRLALPITISLVASLLIALVFVPLAVFLTLPENAEKERVRPNLLRSIGRRAYGMSFGLLNRVYGSLLQVALRGRVGLVLSLAVVFALTVYLPGGIASPDHKVTFTDVQEDEATEIEVDVELPEGTSFEETKVWFDAAEKVMADGQEGWGVDGYFFLHRERDGNVQLWFGPDRKGDKTAREITEELVEALPEKPGITLTTGQQSQVDEEKGETTWRLTLHGEDPKTLETTSVEVQRLLEHVDGVVGVQKASDSAPNEMGLMIDREQTRRYGADPQIVAGLVGYALRGRALPRYHKDGKEIPVRVRFREEDRQSLVELNSFVVPTAAGGVPLSTVTTAKPLATPTMILRRNKKIARTITLELKEDGVEKTRERLDRVLAGMVLPEGISFQASVRRSGFEEDLQDLMFALAISIVLVYLLMGFLFESFVLPFSIVLTIPLSAIGVWWIHFVTGRDIDFLGAVGILLLVGVVVNNGIVLIDTVRALREEGQSRSDAILIAAERRFRPIMMTAITTVGGMVPLALAGANSIGLSYTSFALTLIGGMTSATLLTLLVVPIFYTLFDDLQNTLLALWRSTTGAASAPPASSPG